MQRAYIDFIYSRYKSLYINIYIYIYIYIIYTYIYIYISFLYKHNFFIDDKYMQLNLDTKVKVFHESISCFMKFP